VPLRPLYPLVVTTNTAHLTEIPIGGSPVAEEKQANHHGKDDPEQLNESKVIKFYHL
jgi:hypothetical protein